MKMHDKRMNGVYYIKKINKKINNDGNYNNESNNSYDSNTNESLFSILNC